jgi:hypothetical protein
MAQHFLAAEVAMQIHNFGRYLTGPAANQTLPSAHDTFETSEKKFAFFFNFR